MIDINLKKAELSEQKAILTISKLNDRLDSEIKLVNLKILSLEKLIDTEIDICKNK
jgi:hypothetical protein